ncbi:hypothetical protein VWV82_003966 [Cronobacter malonaticus]|uniref:hypothetical protein n=1 Tax=Cronobacter malonaticus TaxID=413503 RepID=UPI0005189DCF|nr:hypothetical protein [Cronobacter malonaticus]EMD9275323.1 hypothetical protein [Cronobacter malonaticus]KIU64271.1 hypothetical protein CRSA0334_09260 [Cronobacter malonaticus ENBT0334]
MNENNIPLIYLLNINSDSEKALQASGFNAHRFKLNGYVIQEQSYASTSISYKNIIPDNIHEAEIIVIDTIPSNFSHAQGKSSSIRVYLEHTPSYVDLLPLDMHIISSHIFSTKKDQAVIIFCESNTDEVYAIENGPSRKHQQVRYYTYNFNSFLGVVDRSGSRFRKPDNVVAKSLTDLIFKYSRGSHYNLIFNGVDNNDVILAENEGGEAISFVRIINGKTFIFLPVINKKTEFLNELFNNVLPDIPLFKNHFPNNGSFQWISSDAYISYEEKTKHTEIEELKAEYEKNLLRLQSELSELANKDDNLKTKALLTATDDELVFSVKWFLEYIGFDNVIVPDEIVDEENGDFFEEDLTIATPTKTYLFEVKGISGTSSDDQCAQISKIVYRREEANPDHNYKGVYIVNHQRHKDPKERKNPPFFEQQELDAAIARRGMTYTYELFQVYHMIESGILNKADVREAFNQRGLINFRKSLKPLTCDHTFREINVYSFDLSRTPDTTISDKDRVVVKDEDNHWHLLSIAGIQVNKKPTDEATVNSGGSAGVKVDRLVPGAREFFLLKN